MAGMWLTLHLGLQVRFGRGVSCTHQWTCSKLAVVEVLSSWFCRHIPHLSSCRDLDRELLQAIGSTKSQSDQQRYNVQVVLLTLGKLLVKGSLQETFDLQNGSS